ncbi:MAG: hypothetical protein JXR70_17055 [Spirochaetales bacterium]|nr:hypothetical protein [Spirochaetales bacterium]
MATIPNAEKPCPLVKMSHWEKFWGKQSKGSHQIIKNACKTAIQIEPQEPVSP